MSDTDSVLRALCLGRAVHSVHRRLLRECQYLRYVRFGVRSVLECLALHSVLPRLLAQRNKFLRRMRLCAPRLRTLLFALSLRSVRVRLLPQRECLRSVSVVDERLFKL